jgi:Tol biopolymer transport system component
VLYETNGYISFPRVSPDGRMIAFFDHPYWGDDQGFVAVVDLAGKKTTLTKHFDTLRGLAWSPSGGEIWFTAADVDMRVLYGVRLSGALRPLYRSPGTMTLGDVARDGRVLLALEEERNGILGAGPGEKIERDLSCLDHTGLLDISEDGRLLLLNEESHAAGPHGMLVLRNMSGAPPIRLTDGAAAALLSPDGRRVLRISPGANGSVRVLPVGAGETVVIPTDGKAPDGGAWFPDSRRFFLVLSGDKSPPQFFLVDLQTGGSKRPISFEGASPIWAGVTPDARRLMTSRADGSWGIFPVEGGKPVAVPGMLPEDLPTRFSSDGRYLFVFRLQVPLRVFRIDLATGGRAPWKDLEPPDRAGLSYVRSVVLSGDGSAYAYQYRRWLSQLFVVSGLK